MATISGTSDNRDTIAAWDRVLFQKISRFRALLMAGCAPHGDRAIDRLQLQRGARVIDLGCGFGETTRELAWRVGAIGANPVGRVVGIDASHAVLEVARAEAKECIEYVDGDIERGVPAGPYDAAFARFGLMFFARPVIALRNVCRQLVPGGRLCATVWRRREDNEFLQAAAEIVSARLGRQERGDAITCGPGPFSMASADVVSAQLLAAGFSTVELARSDVDIRIGEDLEAAIELSLALGPAGETIRLAGDEGVRRAPELRQALRDGLRRYLRADGVWAPSSAWILDARK
jgi:SAM-dependent methyltransferase